MPRWKSIPRLYPFKLFQNKMAHPVLKSTNNNETIEGKFYESDIFANAT